VNAWIVVTLAGLATLLVRLLPVALLSSRPVPAWLERVGPLTAPVAFAALGASAVTGAAADGPASVLPLIGAVVVAGVVGHRTRSTTWAVGTGMATIWAGAAITALLSR
jgi:branched-subunit amino acid transport protein